MISKRAMLCAIGVAVACATAALGDARGAAEGETKILPDADKMKKPREGSPPGMVISPPSMKEMPMSPPTIKEMPISPPPSGTTMPMSPPTAKSPPMPAREPQN